MKLFNDDDYDPMEDYEFSLMHHEDDDYWPYGVLRGRDYDEDDEELKEDNDAQDI